PLGQRAVSVAFDGLTGIVKSPFGSVCLGATIIGISPPPKLLLSGSCSIVHGWRGSTCPVTLSAGRTRTFTPVTSLFWISSDWIPPGAHSSAVGIKKYFPGGKP